MADNPKTFDTGLTRAQLTTAFHRAMYDYTDAQIDSMIAAKQDVLTFDSSPTENSEHPVTSGGVYTAIAELTARLDGLEARIAALEGA